LIGFGFGASCGDRAVQTGQKEPPAPDGLIFRPTFDTDEGEICAGTGFPLLDNPNHFGQATSGAPIVNQAGQLVAINVGGFELEGRSSGLAIP
jgi:hypothetical protein